MKGRTLVTLILILVVVALAESHASGYTLFILETASSYAIAAIGVDLLLGYTGYFSMVHGALFGVGGYAIGDLALKAHYGFWAAFGLSGLITAVGGLVIGLIAFRARGLYFVVLTLAMGYLGYESFLFLRGITGGTAGLGGVPSPTPLFGVTMSFGPGLLVLGLVLVAVAALVAFGFVNSRVGAACIAEREDHMLARSIGIRTGSARLAAFVLSAAMVGYAGAFNASINNFIGPDNFAVSSLPFYLIVYVVVGGMGTIWGPVLGAFIMVIVPEVLRATDIYSGVAYGIVILLAVRLAPAGLAGLLRLLGVSLSVPARWKRLGRGAGSRSPARIPRLPARRRRGGAPAVNTASLLDFRDITVEFGGVTALRDVSFSIRQGEIHGIIGPNGAGKTTLVNVAAGLVKPTGGAMALDGRTDGPWRMDVASRLGIARTFQQPRAFMNLTVAENLRVADVGAKRSDAGDAWHGRLEEIFGLEPIYARRATDLSFGELRRLSTAVSIAAKPKILILDEPTVGLTGSEIEETRNLITALAESGVTIALVEHNIPFLMSLATSVTVLNLGRVIFQGTPAECQRDSLVRDVYLGEEYAAT